MNATRREFLINSTRLTAGLLALISLGTSLAP